MWVATDLQAAIVAEIAGRLYRSLWPLGDRLLPLELLLRRTLLVDCLMGNSVVEIWLRLWQNGFGTVGPNDFGGDDRFGIS